MRNAMRVLSVLLALSLLSIASAEVKLPHIFSSHMVLQRDREIPVWGWAAPGEAVMLTRTMPPARRRSLIADASSARVTLSGRSPARRTPDP